MSRKIRMTLKRIICFALCLMMLLDNRMIVSADWGELVYIECAACGAQSKTYEDFVDLMICDCGVKQLDNGGSEHSCYDKYHCSDCGTCLISESNYCKECHKCLSCMGEDGHHCLNCMKHKTNMCEECVEVDNMLCFDCHKEEVLCPGCGACMLAITYGGGYICEDKHCTTCDEPFICNGCGDCFYNEDKRANFCTKCEYCFSCANEEHLHCAKCGECFTDHERCESNPEWCLSCCKAEGNHCQTCGDHIEDTLDWCDGGHGTSCAECHEKYLCEECNTCMRCGGVAKCSTCGLCKECCVAKSEDAGCIEGLCVESDDFTNPEHMCEQCESHFSCESDSFCDTCGLCQECCAANAEAFDCACGLCVETTEFEEHICDNCGEPACNHGGICDDCGLCEDCCMERSEEAGCECGMCLEDSGFEQYDHLCTQCGTAFSCVVPFCDICDLCEDCCEDNTRAEGCVHYICVGSKEWKMHFCEICGLCKDDCNCGQPCCDDNAECGCCEACTEQGHCECGCEDCVFGNTGLHNIGAILHNPSNRYGHVSEDDVYDMAANKVSFKIRAFSGGEKLNYQWYYRINGGTAQPLSNSSHYDALTDETYVLTSGADSNSLLTYVPVDACSKNYTYFCVVMDENMNELSRSKEATLTGRHLYDWVPTSGKEDHTHRYQCISCGEIKQATEEAHVPGSWHFKQFATMEQGAILVRRCNVCHYEFETQETEPLEEYHDLYHSYYYIALEYRHQLKNSKKVQYKSAEHLLQCRCSFIGSREAHTWSEWHFDKLPTSSEKGSKWRQCVLCNFRETVEVAKITHEHGEWLPEDWIWDPELFDWASDTQAGYDESSHWVHCPDLTCDGLMYKAPHRWEPVLKEGATLYGNVGEKTGEVWVLLKCIYCGAKDYTKYTQELQHYAVVGKNTTTPVTWAQRDIDADYTYVNLRARAPKGYRFVQWINHTEEYYPNDKLHVRKEDLTNEKLRITLCDDQVVKAELGYDPCWSSFSRAAFSTHAVYFEAQIERIENKISFVKPGTASSVTLLPGQYLTSDWQVSSDAVSDYIAHYVAWDEDEHEYYEDPIYYAHLELNDYIGGPIQLWSTGIPCNLVVEANGVNSIEGDYGIRGCADGGYVEIYSNRKAGILNMNCTPGSDEGINAAVVTYGKNGYIDRSIRISGDVGVNINVNTPNSDSTAYGIYSPSFVKILEDANVTIQVANTNPDAPEKYAVACIYAGQEVLLDTSMMTEIFCDEVDAEKRGVGIDAKVIYLNSPLEIFKASDITHSGMKRFPYGCSTEPVYARDELASYKTDDFFGVYNGHKFELYLTGIEKQGLGITVTSGQFKCDHLEYQDAMSGRLDDDFVKLYESAGVDWLVYADARDYSSSVDASVGTWLSARGWSFDFTVQARPGYYIDSDEFILYADGMEITPSAITDNGTVYHFSLITEDRDITIEIVGAKEFEEPFLNAPSPAKQTALYGSEGTSIDVLISEDSMRTLNTFIDALAEKRGVDYAKAKDFIRKTVSIQAYDEDTKTWVDINQFRDPYEDDDYAPNWHFTDNLYAEAGKTVMYRLTVLFDGRLYTSDTFQISYTNDPNAVVRPTSKAVVLLNDNRSSYEELDGYYTRLVYDVTGSCVTAITDGMYEREKYKRYIPMAEFDSTTGTLSLIGDDIKNMINGSEIKMNVAGKIAGITLDKLYPGDLTVKLLGERSTFVSNPDNFRYMYSIFNDGIAEGAINNPYGQVNIINTGKNDPWLDITTTVSPKTITKGNNEYGHSFAAIYSKNNMTFHDVNLWVTDGESSVLPSETYDLATNYGIKSDENISLMGTANLRIQFGSGRGRNHSSVAVKAGKDLVLNDNSCLYAYSDNNALPLGNQNHVVSVRQCTVDVGRDFYVQDNAEVSLENSGSELCAYAAGSITVNTNNTVLIDANNIKEDRSTDASYALYADGDVNLKKCEKMTLRYRTKDGRGSETNKTAIYFPRASYIRYEVDNSKYTDVASYVDYCPGAGNTLTVRTFGVPEVADIVNFYIDGASGERYMASGRNTSVAAGDRVQIALPGGVLDDLPMKNIQFTGINESDCEIDRTNNYITFTMPDNAVRINVEYTDSAKAYLNRIRPTANSIELSDFVGLNYYFKLPELPRDLFYDKTGNLKLAARFMMNGEEIVTIPLTDDLLTEDGAYKLTCLLAAAELTDDVIVQLVCDGIAGSVYKYSVTDYANTILENFECRDDFEKAQPAVRALLNYGAEAQKYFEHNTGHLANDYLTEEEKVLPALTEDMLSAYKYSVSEKNPDATFVSMSLLLEERVTLRLYFTDKDSNYIHEDIVLNAGSLDVGKTYSFHGYTFTNLSAYSYIAQTGNEKEFSKILAALYAYNEAAKAYANLQ